MKLDLFLRFFLVAILISFLHLKGYAIDVGDAVPDFHTVTIDGKDISYEKDIKGKKPVYLIFWATW